MKVNALDLLAAHMVGDYIFQTNEEAVKKTQDINHLLNHCTKYALTFVPLLFMSDVSLDRKVLFIYLLFGSHMITDSRRWASGKEWAPKPILVDQALHAVQLAILKRLI